MIYLSPPNITDDDVESVAEATKSNWIADSGHGYTSFSEGLKEVCGGGYVSLLSSCSSAIKLALFDMGLSFGDKVIVPSMTFSGAVFPVLDMGLEPVVVGCSSDGNMDKFLLVKALEENDIKAVMLTSIYGKRFDLDLIDICLEHNVKILEDCAESLDFGLYHPKIDYMALSFNGNKTITTGGGGALVVNSPECHERIEYLSRQANDGDYKHNSIGFNMRMSNINASLGYSQLKRLKDIISTRKKVNDEYESLGGFKMLQSSADSSCWLPVALFRDSYKRDCVRDALSKNDIDCRSLWLPVHLQPYLKERGLIAYEGLELELYERGLCLPTGCKNYESNLKKVLGVLSGLQK